uniref:ABC transmembrane type-1 domain-containing protein n=1 Tax=Engystomops pustulosus TaxID=76066 RepID=A0AAV6YRI4_ENGPU|nr:hypothetical protein GDO81_024468 [Engystomops pustulosus]KAG8537480.1 hypothetical protein GDO81_024468 [Engystomops pustulosus]
MIAATILMQYERLRGVRSSGVLIIFWFLATLCAIVPFRSKVMSSVREGVSDRFRFTTFFIYFTLLVLELILSCFKEAPPFFSPIRSDCNPCPEAEAGFLSRLTFWWFTRLAILGYRRPLEDKDLWSLNEDDTSKEVVTKLIKEWEKEKTRIRTTQVPITKTQEIELNHVDEKLAESDVLIEDGKKVKEPSFLKVLLKTFGPFFLIGSVFKLFQDLLSFVNPQLLSILIDFIKNREAPAWWGFSIAALMFLSSVAQTLILHQHFQYCFVTGMRLRSAITGIIYRKVR